ncbi:hypothetical protein [Niveispirillum lacus]|nr:hypothetical protein [Niveispirillum lacus]
MRKVLIGLLFALLAGAAAGATVLPGDDAAGTVSLATDRVQEYPQITGVLRTMATELLAEPGNLAALRQASRDNDDLSVDSIVQRDIAWRLQAKRGRGSLIDPVMTGPLSQFLALLRFPRQALLADLILTDDRGLLVAATRIPSDYDQSDEAKFIAPNSNQPGAVHTEGAAYDESADDYVVTASILLIDPVDARSLGVLSANFTLSALQRN